MEQWLSALTGSSPVQQAVGQGRVLLMGGRENAPMGLTPGQMAVLDALVEVHSMAAVADKLGLSVRTVEGQLYRARQRMGARCNLEAALIWDRMRRSKR